MKKETIETIKKVALIVLVPSIITGGYIFTKKVILKQPLWPIFPKKDTAGDAASNPNYMTKGSASGTKSPILQAGSGSRKGATQILTPELAEQMNKGKSLEDTGGRTGALKG